MDNLRERIDEFHEFDHSEVEDIVREIASLDNIDDKMSLFKSFYTKAITILNGDDFNEFKEKNHFQERRKNESSTMDQMFSLIQYFNKKDETIKKLLKKKNDDYWTILNDNKRQVS